MLSVTSLFVGAGIFVALLCLTITALVLLRRRAEHRILSKRMVNLRKKIESALNDEHFESQRTLFGQALQSASLTTELQRPRLDNLAKRDKQAPEKYRILNKLAAQGLNVEEIAAILGISSTEANQLLNLSSMAQMRQGLSPALHR